ncbi:hypothetical protein PAMP_010572 [Pampus punctatissimus]
MAAPAAAAWADRERHYSLIETGSRGVTLLHTAQVSITSVPRDHVAGIIYMIFECGRYLAAGTGLSFEVTAQSEHLGHRLLQHTGVSGWGHRGLRVGTQGVSGWGHSCLRGGTQGSPGGDIGVSGWGHRGLRTLLQCLLDDNDVPQPESSRGTPDFSLAGVGGASEHG